jgi:Na+-driven multidrug efflux pump
MLAAKASPSMLAFIVAIIVFGLTQVLTVLVLFRYGVSDNQSLPPSTAFKKTFNVGTLIAIAIAASHWLLPQVEWW